MRNRGGAGKKWKHERGGTENQSELKERKIKSNDKGRGRLARRRK